MAWLGEVPVHWEARRLKYVASCNNDVINEDNGPDRLIRYVDIGNVSEGRIQEAEEFSFHNAPSRARRLVKDGDIIISTVRTYLRAIAVIHNPPEEMVVSTGFAAIRPQEIDGNFLAQALKSNAFVDWVVAESKGISYPAINASELMGLSVALPPTEEQSTIATFLDKETTQIDQLIEKKTRFIELLKEKRAALITEAVTGKFDVRTGKPYAAYKDSGVEWLGEVPTHWEALPIKRLTPVQRGASPRPIDDPIYFDENGEFSWVRIADVSSSTGVLTKTKQRLSSLGSSLSVKMYPGSLFLSIAGTVGKPCITKIKCCIHDGFVYFPGLRISNMFLYWVFESGRCYAGLGKMGTQLNLNTETVGGIAIALPGKQDIASILSYLYKKTTKIDQLIEKTQQSISLLKEKRAALITAAVTGKIDVRDFNPKR